MLFTEHLQHRKWNKDNLDSFADQIAQLKKRLTTLLSQQAMQHPGKHADVLVQIELRLTKDRAFYATNEEMAEVFLSRRLKQGGEAPVRPVSLSYLSAGFRSFLWFLGPGRQLVEAIRWYGGEGRHR